MKNKKILITGVTGFVGSHMADYLIGLNKSYKIYGIKRWHLSKMDNIKHIINKIHLYDCDITDPIGSMNAIEQINPDIIFHCAAESFVSPSWNHPHRYMSVNYNGTLNLLEALRKINSKCLFHIPGSGEEYGEIYPNELPINEETVLRPVNPYAVSKIAQDLIGYVYNRSYKLKVIRTRAFNHEGQRRENVFGIPWYAYQIARIENNLQDPIIRVGHIDDKRNFTHVLDMVEAYYLSVFKCKPGELYLIGNEDKKSIYTFRQALEKLIKMSKVRNINYKQDKKYIRPTNVPRLIGNMKKFNKITGWRPKISFEQILSDTLNYWRDKVSKDPNI
jgi:GDP-4-dehydro-6-deoxy-D-mannose reductase